MNIITVNGKQVRVPSGNLTVVNDQIFVDGERILPDETFQGIVEIKFEGENLVNLHSDVAVVVNGNVQGNVRAGNSVNCDSVGGSVHSGNSVNCDDVAGDVTAGNSVNRG